MTTVLPPESVRDRIANIAQILNGATPSAGGDFRLLTKQEHARLCQLAREAVEVYDAVRVITPSCP